MPNYVITQCVVARATVFSFLIALLFAASPVFAGTPTADDQVVLAFDEDDSVNITLTGGDTDGHPITFAIVSQPTQGTLTGVAPSVTYTPAINYNGPDSFTFRTNDGVLDSTVATVSLTVTPVNDQPVITGQGTVSTPEVTGRTILLADLTVTDPDNTYPADFSLSVQGGASYSVSGDTVTPDVSFNGDLTVPVTVTDNSGAPNATSVAFDLTVTVTAVNNVPQITAQDPLSTAEETGLLITLANLTVTDADNAYPGDFTLSVQNGTNYARSGNTITPATDFNGDLTVPVTVFDGAASSPSFDLTVSVTPVNDRPVITGQNLVTTPEATGRTILLTDLTVTDPDNSYPAEFSLSVQGGANYSVLGDTVTPDANFNGNLTVPVTVADNSGAPNATSASFNLTVTVTAVNNVPQITAQTVLSTPEETGLTITLSNLTVTDADSVYPGDFTLSVQGGPNYSVLGDTITPDADFNGDLTVPVTVFDGTASSPAFKLTVSVTPTNDQPVITGQILVTTPEATEYTILLTDLLVTDPDNTYPADFTLTVQGGVNYTVLGAAITPVENFDGDLSVPVTVTDNSGELNAESAVFNLVVTVTAVNDPPVADPQLVSTDEDIPIDITLTGTDPDEDILTFTIVDQPAQGTLSFLSPVVTYTPTLDYNGPDSFTFTVSDAEFTSEAVTVSIDVLPINDAPVAVEQLVTTDEDIPVAITLTGLDAELSPLTFAVSTAPVNGVLEGIAPDLTYTPNLNYNGPDSFTFTVNDGEFDSLPGIVSITVEPVNDFPVVDFPVGPQNAVEGTLFSLDVSAVFSDVDLEALSLSVTGLPPSNNIRFNANTRVISGTPRLVDTEPAVHNITVTATDGDGAIAQDSFTLTIIALDRANVSLDINVAPDPAMRGDQLSWTFTAQNPVGENTVFNVELSGSFVGIGLAVTASGAASCTIQAAAGQVTDFLCRMGTLPVGGTTSVILNTVTAEVGDVAVYATAASTDPVPIDPNPADNDEQLSVGVAEAFSNGWVQLLGGSIIRSVAAGDLNNDGAADLVVGTAAGQPMQIYLSAGLDGMQPCECVRDFLAAPITLDDTAANEGVALADFNEDGFLDLVVANGGQASSRVYRNDGDGNFTLMRTLSTSFAQDVAVGDFDNDNDMDVVFATVQGNPVYLGNGNGNFSLRGTLGSANSKAVAVARFNSGSNDDIVFANVGSDSRVWVWNNSGNGFSSRDLIAIGDAASVTVGEFGSGNRADDLAFGRIPGSVGDIPANPVLLNDGSGRFGNPVFVLGAAPTMDIHSGDLNGDGMTDLVFINSTRVHQVWTGTGGGFELHREQIADDASFAGVLTELGMTDTNDPGGVDLALGGAAQGLSVYLNDGDGNLGRGDAVPPILTLLGEASASVQSGSSYNDAGASADDNIDGDISAKIVRTGSVNLGVPGSYTLTYNVVDFAGNAATPITRNVNVTPSSGGGGGGGAIAYLTLVILLISLMAAQRCQPIIRRSALKDV